MRILMAGGGTGGHLFPGLALAAALRKQRANLDLGFIGTAAGMETQVIPAAGYPLHCVAAGRGSPLSLSRPLNLPRFLLAISQSLRIIKRTDTALIALGGYAAAAPGIAAKLLGVPVIVLEQNSIPGRVNRLLSRWAAQVHNQFAEAETFFPAAGAGREMFWSGSPLRPELAELANESPCAGEALLVIGGSQGATALNELVLAAVAILKEQKTLMPIIHLAGARNEATVRARYADLNLDVDAAVEVYGFAENMPELYRKSRLVISRAGAGSLAELAAAGLPAILLPLPSAMDGHQLRNAEIIAAQGGAEIVAQETSSGANLAEVIRALWNDETRRTALATSLRKTARPQAAAVIAEHILDRFS